MRYLLKMRNSGPISVFTFWDWEWAWESAVSTNMPDDCRDPRNRSGEIVLKLSAGTSQAFRLAQ